MDVQCENVRAVRIRDEEDEEDEKILEKSYLNGSTANIEQIGTHESNANKSFLLINM